MNMPHAWPVNIGLAYSGDYAAKLALADCQIAHPELANLQIFTNL